MNQAVTTETAAPVLQYSHMGLMVKEIDPMEDFYVRVLGFTMTDKGRARRYGNEGPAMVFMTLDPREHHQLFLAEGRPDGVTSDAIIHHLSFRLKCLGDLKKMHDRLKAESDREIRAASHGNTWSLYGLDPEMNSVEFFVETPWYVHQPFYKPMDFNQSEEEIFSRTKEAVETADGFKPIDQYYTELEEQIQS